MKRIKLLHVAFASLACVSAQAQQTTAITYQGALKDNGTSANGTYDLRFTAYNVASGGGGGAVVAGPITIPSISISNGLFTSSLDFGSGVFTGPSRWLELAVRTNGGGSFTTLAPRQALTAAPYALYATNAAFAISAGTVLTGSITAPGIASNQVVKSINGLRDNITLSSGANVTLATNGGNLTISSTGGGAVFSLSGTNAYYSAGNVGIGNTSPIYPLEIGSSSVRGFVNINSSASSVAGLNLTDQRSGGHQFTLYGGSSGSGHFDIYDQSTLRYDLTIDSAGSVGIGTVAPQNTLDVAGGAIVRGGAQLISSSPFLEFFNPGQSAFRWVSEGDFFSRRLSLVDTTSGNPQYYRLTVDVNGNIGIGTTTPGAPLQISGTQAYERMVSSSTYNGSVLELWNTTTQPIDAPPVTLGAINFGNGSTTPGQIAYIVNQTSHGMSFRVNGTERMSVLGDGTVSVGVLQINGADLAEPFEISTKEIPKGSVVTIDQEHPGQLKLSETAYDRKVAGILSGANGVHPGIRLKQDGFNDHGEEVALSGRVYALADATEEPIEPGDLLTTSSTPGHCMRATDPAKSQGAIIGKAMSSLKGSKGMVLVLVSLQ
jgi:hypothetical protein